MVREREIIFGGLYLLIQVAQKEEQDSGDKLVSLDLTKMSLRCL